MHAYSQRFFSVIITRIASTYPIFDSDSSAGPGKPLQAWGKRGAEAALRGSADGDVP